MSRNIALGGLLTLTFLGLAPRAALDAAETLAPQELAL